MTGGGPDPLAAALRRALRAAFGLALEGLSDQQVLDAAAGLDGCHPALAQAGALARVVDALPIEESWMFRDESLWRWLQDDVLPGLVVDALSAGRPLRAASLGCAGGQEAHSLAILVLGLLEAAGIPAGCAAASARILGIDASPARVALAASGEATSWSVQRCPPRWLGGRVNPLDATTGRWQIDAAVRGLCSFEVGNVLDAARPGSQALGGMDLVLCRHVLIYFRPDEAAAVVEGLVRALDPGAILVLSPAEAHLATSLPDLEPAGEVGAFRRVVPETARAPRLRALESRAARSRPPESRAPHPPAPVSRARFRSRPSPLPVAPLPQDGLALRHASAALEHTAAGRSAEALREARAACFHDPRHLLCKLVLGRELLAVDRFRARAVLAELLQLTDALPAEAAVPQAPGLSVGQLSDAAVLLMKRGDGR
jgi:chemotaxis protein methyltransferase CheR